jgi:hypothetical protein
MTVGYSGTPLAKKLGLKPGLHALFEGMPDSVAEEIGDTGILPITSPEPGIDIAHIFVTERAVLAARLATLLPLLAPSGFIWVSWPKKASKVPTDITEDVIREICLPMQLVDVKVCAVDAIWSGLKLMIRRNAR